LRGWRGVEPPAVWGGPLRPGRAKQVTGLQAVVALAKATVGVAVVAVWAAVVETAAG